MEPESSKLRTRSQAAPGWTAQESLILVNEISAVEGDCLNTLSSFQRWKMIVQNCNALDVNRTLNQCKRKWDSLLADYKRSKKHRGRVVGFGEDFDADVFKAIDDYVKANEGRSDTDPDPDEEEDDMLLNATSESVSPGSKKQKSKLMPLKRCSAEKVTPRKSRKNVKIKGEPEEKESIRQSIDTQIMTEKSSQEERERKMTALLLETSEQINAVLNGEMEEEEVDYKLADLKKSKAGQTDITRSRCDKLITCLETSVCTLDQLCHLLQKG